MVFVTPVLEWEMAQWVHLMKDWSDDPTHHQQTLLPQSHISLLMRIIILITISGCLFPRLQWHEMPNLDEHARLVIGVGGEGLRLFGRDGRVPLDQTGHHSAGRLDPQRQRGNVQQQQVLNRLRLVSRQNGSLHGCGNERKKISLQMWAQQFKRTMKQVFFLNLVSFDSLHARS